MGPSRPENLMFRGFRSVCFQSDCHVFASLLNTVSYQMHAGTQTFIQALQAVPWAEDQDQDDEEINHDITPVETESDEDDRIGALYHQYLFMSPLTCLCQSIASLPPSMPYIAP